MPPGLTIPTIFTAVNRFSGPINFMKGSMMSFVAASETGLARVERGFRRMISPLTTFQNGLRSLGLYVGLFSLMMLMQRSVKVIADFEQAQINLASVSDASISVNKALGDQARFVAVQYGQAASAVSNLQYELVKMGFAAPDVMKMTEPISTGAVALRTTPERLAEITAGILLSFEKQASDSEKVINQLAYASNVTAADFESYATQLPIVSRVAFQSGQSYEKVLAYLGTLRNVQIHTATGATSLKNIIIDAATRKQDFRTAIEKVAASNNAVVYAYNKFGKRSVVSALEFAKQLDYIDVLVKRIENAPSGYVTTLAKDQLQGITGKIKLFKSGYQEFILAIDQGNGPIGKATKLYLDAGRALLYMNTDSEGARAALSEMSSESIALGVKIGMWIKIMLWAITVITALKVAMILWRTALIATKIATFAVSVATGVFAAVTGLSTMALKGNIVAMYAARVATMLFTGVMFVARNAMLLFNAVLAGNPMGLLIMTLGIVLYELLAVNKEWDKLGNNVSKTGGFDWFGMGEADGLRQMKRDNPGKSPAWVDSAYFARKNAPIDPVSDMSSTMGLDSTMINALSGKLDSVTIKALNSKFFESGGLSEETKSENSKISLEINNKTGNEAKVKTEGRAVPIKMNSTFSRQGWGPSMGY